MNVTLKDYTVGLSRSTVAAGSITFVADNEGASTHEIEVFRVGADTDPDDLPIANNVADTDGLSLVDEIEDITPGAEAELAIDVSAGTYVVICNLPGHYGRGMHATFDVT